MLASSASRPAGRVRLLQIEPTTRCNYTCGFCVGRHLDQNDLSLDTFRHTLDLLPDLERLEIHGEGEPLMHPDFFEMARLARERGIRLSTVTNGSLFSRERIEQILDSGLDTLFVSIESPREEEFKEIRGGLLSKVVDGIRALLAARLARQLVHPTVGFSVTVLKRTQLLMPEIAKLYAKLGMDGGISAHMLNTMPSYTGFYNSAMAGQLLSPVEQALAWTRYAHIIQEPAYQPSSAAVHFSDEVFGQNDPARQSTSVRSKLAKEYRSCPWLDEGLYVNRHGQASGCARIKDTARFGLGDVHGDALDTVLSRRAELGDALRAGRTPAACAGCFVADAIANRLARLRGARPLAVREVTQEDWDRAMHGPVIGSIPYDDEALRALAAIADGTRTTEAIVEELGERWQVGPEQSAARVLPLLCELVRMKAATIEPRSTP
ncbi:MAG: radical SAM protein [Vicinamibacterales bacterium]